MNYKNHNLASLIASVIGILACVISLVSSPVWYPYIAIGLFLVIGYGSGARYVKMKLLERKAERLNKEYPMFLMRPVGQNPRPASTPGYKLVEEREYHEHVD